MQGYSKGFLYFICAVSAMGGLLFGYDWVVIGGAKPFYELYFGIADSPLMQGVAMTTALVGCLVGAMVAGAAADKYGRKPLLTVSAVLFTVSAIATGLFNDFTLFNIARFIGGIGIGVASALAPMYIAEVSPAEIRGRMVSLNQMTIVLGILGARYRCSRESGVECRVGLSLDVLGRNRSCSAVPAHEFLYPREPRVFGIKAG